MPKIELFARGPAVEGWDLWGNEAPAPPGDSKAEAPGELELEGGGSL